MVCHNQKFYLKNHCSTNNSQITVNNYAQCYKYSLFNLEHQNTMLTWCALQLVTMPTCICVTMSHMNTMHVITVTSMVIPQYMLQRHVVVSSSVHVCVSICKLRIWEAFMQHHFHSKAKVFYSAIIAVIINCRVRSHDCTNQYHLFAHYPIYKHSNLCLYPKHVSILVLLVLSSLPVCSMYIYGSFCT